MKLKINEWQELSAQKDLEHIRNQLINNNRTNSLVNIDLVLALITFTIDSFLSISECTKVWRFIIVGIFSAITIGLLVYTTFVYFRTLYRAQNIIKQNKVDTQKYVSNFDNKVCYHAMVALSYMETYRDNVNEQPQNETDKETDKCNSLQQFCLIECDYYIYKCIKSLYDIKDYIDAIVGVELNDVLVQKKIDYLRIINIIRILKDVRIFLNDKKYRSELLSESDENAKSFLKALLAYVELNNKEILSKADYEWPFKINNR